MCLRLQRGQKHVSSMLHIYMIYGSKVPSPSPICIPKARRSLAAAFPTWDTGASPWVSYGPSRARRIGRWPSCTRRHPGITLRWRRSVSWSSRRRERARGARHGKWVIMIHPVIWNMYIYIYIIIYIYIYICINRERECI